MAITTEQQRAKNNAARLLKISPSIRAHIAAVIAELEAAGYRPQIDAQVWRSPAEQAALKAGGYSQVSYSFHNASTPAGEPDALAADIVDVRWGWNAPRSYWLRLAAAAERQSLTTGIYWGLTTAQRTAIHRAVETHDWDAKIALGWDTAHVECPSISIAEAKKGIRPKLGRPVTSIPKKVRLVLNDKPLQPATWRAPGYFEVRFGDVAKLLRRDVGAGDVAMSIRDALDRLGYEVTKTGDHRAEDGKFYVYAAPTASPAG